MFLIINFPVTDSTESAPNPSVSACLGVFEAFYGIKKRTISLLIPCYCDFGLSEVRG